MDRKAGVDMSMSSIVKMTMKERLEAWRSQKAQKQDQNSDPNSKPVRRKSTEKSALEALPFGSVARKRRSSVGSDKDKDAHSRRRSSEGGRKKKVSGGSRPSLEAGSKGKSVSPRIVKASSESPNLQQTQSNNEDKEALEAANSEIARLNEALVTSQDKAESALRRVNDIEEQMKATWSEIQSQYFLNGVQEQEISVLHGSVATTQLDKSEEVREAKKKYKQERRRLEGENEQLRAMGIELSDQMEHVQNMFISRQAQLEDALEQKQSEMDDLSKVVSIMKLREVESKIRLASMERQMNTSTHLQGHGAAADASDDVLATGTCAGGAEGKEGAGGNTTNYDYNGVAANERGRRSSNTSTGSSTEEGSDGYETE